MPQSILQSRCMSDHMKKVWRDSYRNQLKYRKLRNKKRRHIDLSTNKFLWQKHVMWRVSVLVEPVESWENLYNSITGCVSPTTASLKVRYLVWSSCLGCLCSQSEGWVSPKWAVHLKMVRIKCPLKVSVSPQWLWRKTRCPTFRWQKLRQMHSL